MKRYAAAALMALVSAQSGATDPTLGPLIAGESSYIDGTFVSTDYVYDDRGAQRNQQSGGDDRYPQGLENTADLVQVHIGLNDNGELQLRAILQTLIDADVPEVGFIFDTDAAEPRTGAATVPGGSWNTATPLGAELLVVINSAGTQVWHWQSGDWHYDGELLPSIIDTDRNLIEATLPISAANPAGAIWRAYALAGLAGEDSFLQGGPIYDLAFLRGETVIDREAMIQDSLNGFFTGDTTMWQDHRQAAVLAGELDTDKAAALIDFNKVAAGHTEIAEAGEPGWHTFLFRSAMDLGGGIGTAEGGSNSDFALIEEAWDDLGLTETLEETFSNLFPDESFEGGGGGAFGDRVYLGKYQPYLVHRNAEAPSLHPLVIFLHGASQTHTMNTFWFDSEEGAMFDYPAVTVFPLGRGETLWYEGVSEFDVLEVLADAKARLPVDPDRVVLAGFSMGGAGTYKLASLYPDRFSTAIAHMGEAGGISNSHDIMENLLNLPFRADNGMADYLVNPTFFLPDRLRGLELGYDFRFFEVTDGHHTLQPHLSNCLYLQAFQTPRNNNPPRVHYRVEPERFISAPEIGLELRYEGAYWVSGIVVPESAAHGVVDAVNLSRPDRVLESEVVKDRGVAEGMDYCGKNPAVSLLDTLASASSWDETSIIRNAGPAQPVSNGIQLSLGNIEALTLDLITMGLSSSQSLVLEVNGDGFTELRLLGEWRGLVDLFKNGVAQPGLLAEQDSSLLLADNMTGQVVYELRPRAIGGPPSNPPQPPGPAAGGNSSSGGGAFGIYGFLMLGAILLWRRRPY